MTRPTHPTRRHVLSGGAALAAIIAMAGLARPARAEPRLHFGPPEPFSWDWLQEHARELAARPYEEPPRPSPDVVQRIDYDAHGALKFRPEHALYAGGPGVYPITFRPVGRFFPKAVRMFAIDGAEASEILYAPDYFTIGPDNPAAELPSDISALAGFWLQESRRIGDWTRREPWVTFLGASYFRAVGELGQVGLSARGIALDPGGAAPEEFPDFRAFWLAPTLREGDPQLVYALLDGPSLTGAYRLVMRRTQGVVIEVEKHLHFRRPVRRLGVAPLTSMFWYGEYPAWHTHDWRPEVHDSDTLVIWNGSGEYLARPLNNPPRIAYSSFADRSPKGFGLAQRDRDYRSYLDGVAYDRRPTLWIEPLDDWGEGAVELVEIPTDDEIYDNIVAYWRPAADPAGGDSRSFRYRMHWVADEPFHPTHERAKAVATRIGRGGEPGKERPAHLLKVVIEWDGPILKEIPYGVRPEVVASASRGTLSLLRAEPIWYTPRWRSEFDLDATGQDMVELRCELRLGGRPITEPWLWQWWPAPA